MANLYDEHTDELKLLKAAVRDANGGKRVWYLLAAPTSNSKEKLFALARKKESSVKRAVIAAYVDSAGLNLSKTVFVSLSQDTASKAVLCTILPNSPSSSLPAGFKGKLSKLLKKYKLGNLNIKLNTGTSSSEDTSSDTSHDSATEDDSESDDVEVVDLLEDVDLDDVDLDALEEELDKLAYAAIGSLEKSLDHEFQPQLSMPKVSAARFRRNIEGSFKTGLEDDEIWEVVDAILNGLTEMETHLG